MNLKDLVEKIVQHFFLVVSIYGLATKVIWSVCLRAVLMQQQNNHFTE